MKAVIIGGSGATGRTLTEQLLSDPSVTEVTVLLRKKSFTDHPKLNQITVDFDRLDEYSAAINGDVAFSCLGTTLKIAGSKAAQWKVDYGYQLKFAEIAARNHIPCFVLVSSMNANSGSMFFYSRMKGKLEESIAGLPFERVILFRPGLLERPGSDRPSENRAVTFVRRMNKIGWLKKLAPTPVHELAQALIYAAKTQQEKVTIASADQIKDWKNRVR